MVTPDQPGRVQSPGTCPEKVWRGGDYTGNYEPCGKTVKRDGLCGVHANSKDRADAHRVHMEERLVQHRVRREAAGRVLRFLDEAERRGYGDSLIGFGQANRDDSDEIRMSDLRLLLGDRP